MGKKSWKRKQRNQEDRPPQATRETNEKGVRKNYEDIVKENETFETYYKMQGICPESEWDSFMSVIRTSLPATFRITGSRGQAKALLHHIEKKLLEGLTNVDESNEEELMKPFPLPWYPENLAWQINLSRKDIRRNEANFRLHHFLITETESGNISRQEAVSMIPPIVLDVEPHHKVLDMCAAPGSKTAQIIEMLHAKPKCEPSGVLIANDMDNKRCYMLVHQAKRLQSPAFMITNHDASNYPDLVISSEDGGEKKKLKFDRVLCDVPCSGDGTIRKNVDVWKKWRPSNAMFLHQTQYLILKRGLELLEVGGQLVYSTCSLNPIENECVIHRILKEFDGTVELLDISLPNLKHSNGLSYWKPCGPDLVTYGSMQDVPQMWRSLIRDYHFPPSTENAAKYKLDKCVRILPHHQNSGGFFVARLQKLKTMPKENDGIGCTQTDEPRSSKGNKPPPAKRHHGFKEDPYIFMSESDQIWPPIRNFYCLDTTSLDSTNFLTRSVEGKKKNIYLTTRFVKDIITNNVNTVKIVNTGIKTFVRCDNKFTTCDFRLAQEGLQSILPYIQARKVTIPKEDLIILLLNDEEHTPPKLDTLSEGTQDQIKDLERGSLVLIMDSVEENGGPAFRVELIGWRGLTSLRAYVAMNERVHYLHIVGGDVTKFQKNKFQIQSEEANPLKSEAVENKEIDIGFLDNPEAEAGEEQLSN